MNKYPKPIMRKSELVNKMGFDKEWLMYIYRTRSDKKIAWKGAHKNSPIYFDTVELEKFRRASCVDV